MTIYCMEIIACINSILIFYYGRWHLLSQSEFSTNAEMSETNKTHPTKHGAI